MKYLKKISKSLLFTITIFVILSLIITLLNYFNIINYNLLAICKIIIPMLSLAIGGFIIGKNSLKNGWLEGLKFSLIIILIITIIIICIGEFTFKKLIYFILLIGSGILGSMIGINKQKNT
jgi:putative membrane protein (TIGR04086 family)